MLNVVQVRAVGGKIFESVSGSLYGSFRILATVECGAVHHQNRSGRQLWKQIALEPEIEYVCIDVRMCQPDAQQDASQQCPDDIHPATGVPVTCAKALLPARRIAVCARLIHGETALINVQDGAALLFINLNFLLEELPFGGVRLRVCEGFFYR